MAETTAIKWVEIDRYYDFDAMPDCAAVGCDYSVIGPPRRLFRQVGGVDDGLVLCERCMGPGDLLQVRQTQEGRP